MRFFQVDNFDKGLITQIENFSIPENAASDSLNWLTKGDHIELTGGYTVVDPNHQNVGLGRVTGLILAPLVDGSTQAFYSYGKKVKYLDSNDEWQEIGTDILTTAADGEDIAMTAYVSIAGYQTWISSPNSSLFKIMNANPASYTDMYDATKNFKGYIDAQNSRLNLWYKNGAKNYLYGSWKDAQDSSVYTAVTNENIGTGDGSTVTFTDTLLFKAGGVKRTCFNVTATDGTETFNDNKDGTLTGNLGGTGTINYTTGAISVTFNTAPVNLQAITSNYEYENSTVHGIADFTFSATRVAGEGYFLPQNTGGDLLNVLPYQTDFYCIHSDNVYLFSMPVDDLSPTNQIFRRRVGMPYWRAAVPTGDGIYYIDTSDPITPHFNLITLSLGNNQVIPQTINYNLDLRGYNFDLGVGREFGDYIMFSGRTNDSDVPNRLFVFNKIWKSFDVLEYNVSCMEQNGSYLWAGDAISNNVLQLFDGYSANGTEINNYWTGKLTKLEIDDLKKYKRLTLDGYIGVDQNVDVLISYDRGAFTYLDSINGQGSYVDEGDSIAVGGPQIGQEEIGGGTEGATAFHYRREIIVRTARFSEVQLKFVATAVGYVSISYIRYWGIHTYGNKNLLRYRAT